MCVSVCAWMCFWACFFLCVDYSCPQSVLFWHFRQSLCWSQPSNNSSLTLLVGYTAGSASQHLASLTQNASSSSRRVSHPLLHWADSSTEPKPSWSSQSQWDSTVETQGKIPSPTAGRKRNWSVVLIEYLSVCYITVGVFFSKSLVAFLSFLLSSSQLCFLLLIYQVNLLFLMSVYLPVVDNM